MGLETFEVLVLGAPDANHETIYVTPESEVPLGVAMF